MKTLSQYANYLVIMSLALLPQVLNAKSLSMPPPKYKPLEIKKANITIDFPRNWIQKGKKTAWFPKQNRSLLIGFKWASSAKSDWEPTDMLPKNSDFIGPFMLSVGWGEGLLYIVQLKRSKRFEIHTVIPRMEAALAYDFYASAPNLAQMKRIESVYQRVRQSGTLQSIKEYFSENPEECKSGEMELECDSPKDEFFDKKGCGCLIAPRNDYGYDN